MKNPATSSDSKIIIKLKKKFFFYLSTKKNYLLKICRVRGSAEGRFNFFDEKFTFKKFTCFNKYRNLFYNSDNLKIVPSNISKILSPTSPSGGEV